MGLIIAGSLAVGLAGEGPTHLAAGGLDLFDLVLQAGIIVQLVILVLALLSVFSWAVIAFKWRELRSAEQDSEAFLEVYRSEGFDAAYGVAEALGSSPLSELFLEGAAELERHPDSEKRLPVEAVDEAVLRRLAKRLSWTGSQEIQRFERGLSFLATTGSASPFIGLFGTVVGIIGSFQGIAATGSASLAVVAPGIAEALIATAVGLLAAIPATIFYNHFLARSSALGVGIELFLSEFEEDLIFLARGGRSPGGESDPK